MDDSGQPSSARWWSPHNTLTDEREAEQLQSVLLSAGRGRDGGGWWVGKLFPGFRSDASLAPHMFRHTHTKTTTSVALSQQIWGMGVMFLFVAIATGDSLSFPSLSRTSRCEQTHTCEVCLAIEDDRPLQLVDGSLFSEQPANDKTSAHMMETEE